MVAGVALSVDQKLFLAYDSGYVIDLFVLFPRKSLIANVDRICRC